ncbi:MAG: hypothetical protein LQ351_001578 [Letrouitia transgressa]|nr:MAG: hypothetical protein LQ351_001578 [Letrouitia transgressa]
MGLTKAIGNALVGKEVVRHLQEKERRANFNSRGYGRSQHGIAMLPSDWHQDRRLQAHLNNQAGMPPGYDHPQSLVRRRPHRYYPHHRGRQALLLVDEDYDFYDFENRGHRLGHDYYDEYDDDDSDDDDEDDDEDDDDESMYTDMTDDRRSYTRHRPRNGHRPNYHHPHHPVHPGRLPHSRYGLPLGRDPMHMHNGHFNRDQHDRYPPRYLDPEEWSLSGTEESW